MRSLTHILGSARQLWPFYLGIVVASVLTAALGLLTPFIIAAATDLVVDATTGQGPPDLVRSVVWLAAGLLLAELLGGIVQNIGGYLGDTMAARMRDILSTRYFAKLLGLPQRYFDDEVTGTIISRLHRSITEITAFLQSFANNFFPMLITVAAVLVVSASYFWPLALLLAAIFPTYFWLTTLTSARWQRLEAVKNREIDLAGGRFAEVVGQIRVVKSFVAERRELAHFARRFSSTVATTREQSRYWHGMDAIRRSVLALIFFGVYAILFVRTANGHMTIGDMVLLIQLVGLTKNPVALMSYLVDTAQRAMAGSRAYFEVMAQTPEAADVLLEIVERGEATGRPVHAALTNPRPGTAGGTTAGTGGAAGTSASPPPASSAGTAASARPSEGPRTREEIREAIDRLAPGEAMLEFDHVTFGYDPDHPVLHDVTFTVGKGEHVALVSESGGGKTTLVNLLLGFYRVSSGRVRLAGYDVTDLPPGRLRSLVGVVFQDASLFSGTIGENISYGDPDASEESIRAAASRAYVHPFVRGFADGYDTLIGERGLKLSGGQKQRVAVARAMLKDAPVLVLDEATSALDTKSERLVQRGLDELMADRTSIVIAHRLSTISAVDLIVTLTDGRVREIGSPDDLAGTDGIYAELLSLQASASRRDRKRLREFGILG